MRDEDVVALPDGSTVLGASSSHRAVVLSLAADHHPRRRLTARARRRSQGDDTLVMTSVEELPIFPAELPRLLDKW